MKIAVPVDEKKIETNVCQSFGRAPYFLIYNTDTSEYTFLDNSAAASQGGAGIKAAQTIADNQIGALLTFRCGQNAADVLKAASVQIFKVKNDALTENIEAFKMGKLALLEEIHAGFHGHGGK